MRSNGQVQLLRIDHLQRVSLEFTTRCNLRCTYCAVSRPWHIKRDLDLERFDDLVAEFHRLGVQKIQVSGGGETTIVKNWDRYLYKLVDEGFQVTIITNLAKHLGDLAVRALSRCVEITTSCDTVNAEKYAAIRQGADLRQFLSNIELLRARVAADGRAFPRFIWNCVTNDQVVFDLVDWVKTGLALGVDHFQLSELTQFPDVPGVLNVRPLGSMDPGEIERARKVILEAKALAESQGKYFTIVQGVQEVLDGSRKVSLIFPILATGDNGEEHLTGSRRLVQIHQSERVETIEATTPSAPGGLTRNCLLPWSEAYIRSSNYASPCCLQKGVSLYENATFHDALNAPDIVRIREGLLTGNMDHNCRICGMFDLVEPETLRATVAAHLTSLVPQS